MLNASNKLHSIAETNVAHIEYLMLCDKPCVYKEVESSVPFVKELLAELQVLLRNKADIIEVLPVFMRRVPSVS